MKIIDFKGIVASATGKLYKGSNYHIRRDRKSGQHIGVHRIENYQYSRSAEQAEMRRSFGMASRAVSRWLKANPPGSPDRRRMEELFERQLTYTRFDTFLMSHLPGG